MTPEAAFGLANAALRVSPAEYWRLTPAELTDMISGANAREERVWERAAWQTAYLLNVAGKYYRQEVTANDLLGRKKKVIQPIDPVAKFEQFWKQAEADRSPED